MPLLYEELTRKIIGAAMEVHRTLGCGFLEGVYQEALEMELQQQGIAFVAQRELNITYQGRTLKQRYKPDLMGDDRVIVEIKALPRITSIEEAQVINYLKLPATKLLCSSTSALHRSSGSVLCCGLESA